MQDSESMQNEIVSRKPDDGHASNHHRRCKQKPSRHTYPATLMLVKSIGLGVLLRNGALVKALVELHGGWVALQSEPGAGATFTCHLPEIAYPGAAAPELQF